MYKSKKILFLASMVLLSICDISYAGQKKERDGMGADAGAHAGESAALIVTGAITKWGGSVYSFGAAALPYVGYGAAGAAAIYGGHRAWRYFRPTREEQAAEQANIDKYRLQSEEYKRKAQEERAKGIAAGEVVQAAEHRFNFKKCLASNPMGPRNGGIPLFCADSARNLAIFSGAKEVGDIVTDFEKFSRPPSPSSLLNK